MNDSIITVHGIRDDYRTAWTDKNGQWWVRTQLFGALATRQLDYSYEIDEQETIFEPNGIFTHAQKLIEQLSADREGLPEVSYSGYPRKPLRESRFLTSSNQTEVDRPILWLCHDIGGIIAKQVTEPAINLYWIRFSHLVGSGDESSVLPP